MVPIWDFLKPEKEVMVVNLTTVPIGKEELRVAFAVSENILWWRAIMHTLETRRQEAADAAGAAATELRMAMEVGKQQVLGEVIADLQKLRKESTK